MLKKFALALTVTAASISLTGVRAQQQPLDPQNMTPEQQQMIQQMQDMGNQIQNNMQNRGIDPQEFFGQMQQAMSSGDADPQEVIQQMLIDQGLISQDSLNQMYGSMRTLALSSIRQQLGSTDEEWALVERKLQRIVSALSDAEQDTFGRLAGRMLSGTNNASPMEKARKDLRAVLADPNASPDRLRIVVDTWRREHKKAKEELVAAREDLTNILTLRQEAILVSIGVL